MEGKIILVVLLFLKIKSCEGLKNGSKSIKFNRVPEHTLKILVRNEHVT